MFDCKKGWEGSWPEIGGLARLEFADLMIGHSTTGMGNSKWQIA